LAVEISAPEISLGASGMLPREGGRLLVPSSSLSLPLILLLLLLLLLSLLLLLLLLLLILLLLLFMLETDVLFLRIFLLLLVVVVVVVAVAVAVVVAVAVAVAVLGDELDVVLLSPVPNWSRLLMLTLEEPSSSSALPGDGLEFGFVLVLDFDLPRLLFFLDLAFY
jgi:hypothetical protein